MLVSVRDHYVDVLTDKGKASLLMRFSDAIAETSPEPGARVHRSYWVAWAAVAATERSGATLRLRLTDGTLVPVSRAQRATVEARGSP
jgi:DNA-binding LytR/AlgR family response regulator